MRCNNCGWDNAPGATNCIKCGHSLQVVENNYASSSYNNAMPNVSEYGVGQQPRPTVLDAGGQGQPMPRPTVLDTTGRQEPAPRPTRIINSAEASQVANAQTSNNCPNCGYLVAAGFTSCPNCGTAMSQISSAQVTVPNEPLVDNKPKKAVSLSDFGIDENVKCEKCGTDVSIEFSFCPKCGEKIHLPTVRAIRHKPAVPEPPKQHCSLTLILEEEEVTNERKNDYEGDVILLNRDNTEPDNRTITSKEQAELSFKDGKWYITNKSELCSTYVEAGRDIEIQSGDIIVMGDRRFKFETES